MKVDDIRKCETGCLEKAKKQAVRHLRGMPRQCLGSDRSRDQVISPTCRKESTSHGGGDDVEIPAALWQWRSRSVKDG